jgi:hypothetical protein
MHCVPTCWDSTLNLATTASSVIQIFDAVQSAVNCEITIGCVQSFNLLCTARFNIYQFYVQPTQCIYVLYVDLRKNSDYFPILHLLVFIRQV